MKKMRGSALMVGAVVGLFAVGIVGGTAFATVPKLLAPAGVTNADASPAPKPSYARNESGLTFGSAAAAISPDTEPDLILVQATNGKVGYALKADLDRVDGADAISTFKSPDDAVKWQAAQSQLAVSARAVPVYESDGKTKIGEFVVSANAGGPGSGATQ